MFESHMKIVFPFVLFLKILIRIPLTRLILLYLYENEKTVTEPGLLRVLFIKTTTSSYFPVFGYPVIICERKLKPPLKRHSSNFSLHL